MNPRSTLNLAGVAAILVGLAFGMPLGACASHHQPYVAAAKVTLGISSALQTASEVADSSYKAGLLTGKQLNDLRAKLEPLATTTLTVERVLEVWPADQPTPKELRDLDAALAQAVSDLGSLLPMSGARDAILGHLKDALAIADALLKAYGG